jgi:hypothetical protein
MARRDVHPEISRALGASDVHAANADRLLDEAQGKPRKKQPSLEDIKEDIVDEISSVIRELDGKKEQSAFSLKAPLGWHFSAKGRVAWFAALLVAVVAVAWIAGRVTRHRHERPTQEAPAAK